MCRLPPTCTTSSRSFITVSLSVLRWIDQSCAMRTLLVLANSCIPVNCSRSTSYRDDRLISSNLKKSDVVVSKVYTSVPVFNWMSFFSRHPCPPTNCDSRWCVHVGLHPFLSLYTSLLCARILCWASSGIISFALTWIWTCTLYSPSSCYQLTYGTNYRVVTRTTDFKCAMERSWRTIIVLCVALPWHDLCRSVCRLFRCSPKVSLSFWCKRTYPACRCWALFVIHYTNCWYDPNAGWRSCSSWWSHFRLFWQVYASIHLLHFMYPIN